MKLLFGLLLLVVLGLADLQAQLQRPGGSTGRGGSFGRQMDANGDGKISREEFPGPKEMFDQFDKDKNNFLSPEERDAMRQGRTRGGFGGRDNSGGGFRRPNQAESPNLAEQLFSAVDGDKDKSLSAKEWYLYFDKILNDGDANKDGNVSAEEWKAWRQRSQENSRPSGRGVGGGLQVGDPAPQLSAQFMTQKGSLEFNKITRLSVIIFGSYT